MNGAQAVAPAAAELNAICAIRRGDLTFGNYHGCAVYIGSGKLLAAAHLFADTSVGYHSLPGGSDQNARLAYFRIKSDGSTTTASGLDADYQIIYITGYRVAPNGNDMVLCDLASTPAHITAHPVYTGEPAATNSILIAGWGLDGAAINDGSRTNDCKKITGRTILSEDSSAAYIDGVNPGPNLYDSGGLFAIDDAGTFKIAGVIVSYSRAQTIYQFRNDASFQIPGLFTPSSGGVGPTETEGLSPTFDTGMDSNDPTGVGDLSNDVQINVGEVTGKNALTYKMALSFNVSAISGPLDAELRLTTVSVTVGDTTLRIRRFRRITTSALTYNTYDGTQNWTAAGANDTSNDVYTANQFTKVIPDGTIAGTRITFDDAGLLEMIRLAIADDGQLRILIEVSVVDSGGVALMTQDNASVGDRPALVISSNVVVNTRTRDAVNDPQRLSFRAR